MHPYTVVHGSGQPSICVKLYRTDSEGEDDWSVNPRLVRRIGQGMSKPSDITNTSSRLLLVALKTGAVEHERQTPNRDFQFVVCCTCEISIRTASGGNDGDVQSEAVGSELDRNHLGTGASYFIQDLGRVA